MHQTVINVHCVFFVQLTLAIRNHTMQTCITLSSVVDAYSYA